MLAAQLQIDYGSYKEPKRLQESRAREMEMHTGWCSAPMGFTLAETSCLLLSKDAARVTCATFGVATFVACCLLFVVVVCFISADSRPEGVPSII